ncbi:MAG TPA: lipocalin-like domain-containing protein [Thermoanaerobaculia bacterium]
MQNAKCRIAVLSAFCILHSAFAADRPGRDGFLLALPGYEYEFPRDHGSHDGYRTEWWYYTGHLRTSDGHRYGFELTFFRVGVDPAPAQSPWDLRNLALAHFAITDVDGKRFRYYEKLNRSSPYTARAAAGYLDVFNEGWRAITLRDGTWRIVAKQGDDAIDLLLRSRKPPAIHGENGVSIKAAGEGYASHYYSMTRLETSGRVNGRPCSGRAWMDHEFGSSALRENQRGWDWYSIQLDNDSELMLYVIRRDDGTPDVTSSGSLITADGHVIPIRHDQMKITAKRRWTSTKSGATYPLDWTVAVPSLGISLSLRPLLDDQELVTRESTRVTYWEGAVNVNGSFDNVGVNGEGYVEMTGYDRALRAP